MNFTPITKSIAAFGLAAILSLPGTAEQHSYEMDEAHTSVLFFVNHLGFSNMQGEINDVAASLSLDMDDLSKTTLTATMQSISVDMDNDDLNFHIRTPDFFDVRKHPLITFTATKVTPTDGGKAVMTGDLTMLGQTHSVDLDVEVAGKGVNPITNNYTIAFHATGALKRSEWGMTYLVPGVGDDVKIDISAEFVQQ